MKRVMVMMGAVAALVMGGAGAAQAAPSTGGFDCQNSGVVSAPILSCNDTTVIVPLKLDLEVDRVLSDTEILTVEDTLNHLTVNAANLVNVKNVLNGVTDSFNPSVDIDKVLLWVNGVGPVIV